jgi:hypothetical protein
MGSLREPYDIDIPLRSAPLTAEELVLVRAYIASYKKKEVAAEKRREKRAAVKARSGTDQ